MLLIIGHDVITAQQLKEAIDSYGGVRGCRVAVIEVNTMKQTSIAHRFSCISQLNNFRYTEDGEIIVWKAFQVGEGRKFLKQELMKMGQPQGETGVNVILATCEPEETIAWDAEENVQAAIS